MTASVPASVTTAVKILYIDLDNTLVDFPSGIARLTDKARAEFHGHYDDAPGIFGRMEPLAGAVEAYKELALHFDTYILSTAPWHNASAWHDKVLWVQTYLGLTDETAAYKRLILSHHKNLNRGDYLIDDRSANGAGMFEGEWLQFGTDAAFPTWASVTDYLLSNGEPSQLHAAITLARTSHAGQVDKLGVAYIYHPLAVMQGVTGEDAKIVAVLHDVVEDTPVTLDHLRTLGFAEPVVRAVDAVTKRPGESLAESMARVAADPLALVVKLADLAHNANPKRQAGLPEDVRARLKVKYEESAAALGTSLEAIFAKS
ncbi:hypothetical protein K2F54_14090 [Cryobacterium sp. 1639]|uniref:5' nucleotidase, NT5C type n=1 Tax=Cryobacterium inferilacus TaxID=2866629 RepID=UPI001C733457|nr:hypothetical protein [Cryobacterium sp. 1639]MBX0301101.1 hypothetical protein [Cryobacterium sp. 1639]